MVLQPAAAGPGGYPKTGRCRCTQIFWGQAPVRHTKSPMLSMEFLSFDPISCPCSLAAHIFGCCDSTTALPGGQLGPVGISGPEGQQAWAQSWCGATGGTRSRAVVSPVFFLFVSSLHFTSLFISSLFFSHA